jgi:hypothetical protein
VTAAVPVGAGRPLLPPPVNGDGTIDAILDALERDRDRHLLAPCTEDDLDALQSGLAWPLPRDYRRLLSRLGGGLYYDRHEVFGALRLMVHDIELALGALAMRSTLSAASGGATAPFLLPLHRDGDAVHWLDLRSGRIEGPGGPYADLAAFLSAVVLVAADGPG